MGRDSWPVTRDAYMSDRWCEGGEKKSPGDHAGAELEALQRRYLVGCVSSDIMYG
ncbi:MAG: hypothetical protein ACYS83_10155 [Planctomycetota bacterium]